MTRQTETIDRIEGSVVAMARAGDAPAVEELVRTHWSEAYRVALRIMRSHEDAEDVAQDALWAAVAHLATFRERASFRTWLHRIVVNHSLIALRRKRSRAFESHAIPIDAAPNCVTDTQTPEETLLEKERRSLIEQGLSRLPSAYSVALNLYSREGKTVSEIADRMGISEGAAKTRLHRGRERLRREIVRLVWVNISSQFACREAESIAA
jgi:RNA polymerase sigma-70 factor (ECF subfamily)